MRNSLNGIAVGIIVVALASCSAAFGPDGNDDGAATLSVNVHGLAGVGSAMGTVGARSTGGEMGARAIDPSGIVFAEVTVDALNFSAPVTETVSLTNGAGSSTLTGLATGPNRVITVVGVDTDGNAVAGAEISATVDVYPGTNSATVDWDTTPRGRVFGELLAEDRSTGTEYSVTVDAAAVQTKIAGIISARGLGHPHLVDAAVLAGDIVSEGGAIPASDGYVRATGSVPINITGLGSGIGWPIDIVVTDPTSQPISVRGDGAYTIDDVLPGDWNILFSVNDGAYYQVLTLGEITGGSSVSSATDADGNAVDLATFDVSADLDVSIPTFSDDAPATIPQADFSSSDVPASITDYTTATSTLSVSGMAAAVSDVDVSVNMTHTYVGDLEVSLISPAGTTVMLSRNRGGGGNNFDGTEFDDDAATAIGSGSAPFSGSFVPDEPLAAFNNEDPNGTWTLSVKDEAGGDTGALTSWSISLTSEETVSGGGTGSVSVSYNTVGTFSDSPGVKSVSFFGGSDAFGFGRSTCGASCFDRYTSTLTINLGVEQYVSSLSFEQMEAYGNWGSKGTVILDGQTVSGFSFGGEPGNSGVADSQPRTSEVSIGMSVREIEFHVRDITSQSEILIAGIYIDGVLVELDDVEGP
jgi:subtilisin-like proprotein convertase family protein